MQGKHITTPKLLYDWAIGFFKNIEFDFCTRKEHEIEKNILKGRF